MDPQASNVLQVSRDVFVGRQPIYGRRLELYAYELLYRGADVDYADFTDGDRATSQVILNTFTEFGLERVVGGHLAFINLTRGFIVGEYPLPIPRSQVVLEVLEDIEPDAEVVAGLRNLRRRGFKIALDDFVYRPELEPMIEMAHIIKVDVLGLSNDEIQGRFEDFAPFKVKLLAEKIETREQYEFCHDQGFDYFQGYFLAKPNVVSGASLPTSELSMLRLMAEFQDPSCDFDSIHDMVRQDVTLSYKLLRHIDSLAIGMPRKIDSIHETLDYLGLSTVRSLSCLFLLSSGIHQPHELIVTSMMRAKMCEQLATAAHKKDPDSFFTVGLFSTLDVLIGSSMSSILDRLPLTEELSEALLSFEGDLGEALQATLAYERGEWSDVRCFGLELQEIKRAFYSAVDWVDYADGELRSMAA